jgi:hypothetical protein
MGEDRLRSNLNHDDHQEIQQPCGGEGRSGLVRPIRPKLQDLSSARRLGNEKFMQVNPCGVSYNRMPGVAALGAWFNPPLSAVVQPATQIGEKSGLRLLDRIGAPRPNRPIRFAAE